MGMNKVFMFAYNLHLEALENKMKSRYGALLQIQNVAFWIALILNLTIMIRVMRRLYTSFDCLKFHWSTILIVILGTPLMMLFPIYLLWTFFKHGVTNSPAGHVVVVVARKASTFAANVGSFLVESFSMPSTLSRCATRARLDTEARAGVLLETAETESEEDCGKALVGQPQVVYGTVV